MASMNWLGFSLSPQQLPSHEPPHEEQHSQTVVPRHGFNSEGISGTDVSGGCFDITSHSATAHSLNLPPSFGIFEALKRSSNTHDTPQDWNTKGNHNSHSLLLGTSCNNYQQEPKLENFLGQHSFGDHDHPTYGGNSASSGYFISPNYSLKLPASSQPPEKSAAYGGGGGDSGGGSPKNTNSIGLSMIKTWLRNQPPQQHSLSDGAAASISLSMMSTVSQSSSSVALPLLGGNVDGDQSSSSDNKQQQPTITALEGQAIVENAVPPRKSIDTFGQRTSIYRGVTRHRWTGRYEAHLWDNSCRRDGQTRKGRQVYLGGYDKEEKAARAYDLAALKYWGTTTTTNFPISHYEKELEEMKHMTRQEYVASLRRKSSGFSRGASIYRGVTRHHQHGRWQARIGRVAGNKDLYLGTFSTQEEAAEAYDIAAIKFRGPNAVTNFDMSRYDVKSILGSDNLPIGGAKRMKDNAEQVDLIVDNRQRSSSEDHSMSSQLSYGANNNQNWPSLPIFQHQPQPYSQLHNNNYPFGQKLWCKQEQDVDASQTFQDIHQLQLGNTHNFFQSNSGLHSFLSIDSASTDNNNNSSGSNNPVIYGGGDGYGGSGGYMIPIGTNNTFIANDGDQNQRSNGFADNDMKLLGYENVINSSHDPYHARNMYYLSQQTSTDAVKGSAYDACNTWVPTAIPSTLAPRPNNVALCTGAQPFTLLHE